MSAIESMMYGFEVALTWQNIMFVLIGVLTGTVIGMLPGLGPISAIAVMIPLSYGMEPASALILMAGVYYGAIFGGSTSSILLNAPGIASTVASTFDGYPLAQQGKAGKALAIAAIASFIGGTVATVGLMLVAPQLSKFALTFGPTEYFALMLLGLTAIASLSDGSIVKAFISACAGIMVATIGVDSQTGTQRFTFGITKLFDGIDFLVIALGLFALAEVTSLIISRKESLFQSGSSIGSMKITKQEAKAMSAPVARQSVFGFFIGVLPGAGATIASFLAYITEKRISKDPSSFGKGNVVGLAAPETANNAAAGGSFVPLLTLGIPGSGTTAIMLGALLVVGVQPGPMLLNDHPDIFWGVIASMYIGNVMLLVLNLPLIPYIAKILHTPKQMLISFILIFCLIGVYGVSFSTFDLYVLITFGVIGYIMRLLSFPAAPFILAFILGGMMEQSFRQALTISNGSLLTFVEEPLTATLLVAALASLIMPFLLNKFLKKKRV